MDQTQPASAFVNKVLSKHGLTHVFTYRARLQNQEGEQTDFTAYKAKTHVLSELLRKKFANLWLKHT